MNKKSIAFFNSNDIYPVSADSTLPFEQHRDIFYLSGVDQEESVLMLCPSASEDIFQDCIEGFDVYDQSLAGEDLSLFYPRMIADSSLEIHYVKDGKEETLPLTECTVNKSKVNENDLKDHFDGDKGIAYSFGY